MKNCNQCFHLESVLGDEPCNSGNECNKRTYKNETEREKHLEQLLDVDYLKRPKKCCEPHPFTPIEQNH